jgi:acyl-CoA synthetase (AMP-forming)/AMP-acid ligase II
MSYVLCSESRGRLTATKPFPMSPRNSVAATAALLEKTSCHRILSQPVFAPVLSTIKESLGKEGYVVDYQELPTLEQIFPEYGGHNGDFTVESFPTPREMPSPHDLVLYLHSSGSTGLPKPIVQRQVTVMQWCTSRECSTLHTWTLLFMSNVQRALWRHGITVLFKVVWHYRHFIRPVSTHSS